MTTCLGEGSLNFWKATGFEKQRLTESCPNVGTLVLQGAMYAVAGSDVLIALTLVSCLKTS